MKSNLKWINSTFSRLGLWKSESEKLIENHYLSQLGLDTVLLTSHTTQNSDVIDKSNYFVISMWVDKDCFKQAEK